MKKQTIEIQEQDLHAYVDKQLSPEKVEAVEALMKADAKVAQQVHQWQLQNKGINDLFAQKDFSDIPDRLSLESMGNRLGNDQTEVHQKQGIPWFYSLAASVLMVASGAIGWFSNEQTQPKSVNTTNFVNSAISAYQVYSVEVLHPVEVGADKRDHLVAWLSKRIDHPLKVPDLQAYGYKLLGGRLLSMTKGRPAAQLMFENKEGKRVTLLVSKNPNYHNQAFNLKNDKEINAFYWMDETMAYSIASEMNSDALRELSKTVYQQLLEKEIVQLSSL